MCAMNTQNSTYTCENTLYRTFNNAFTWRVDKDGLLRCTTNVLKRCVMPYTVKELGDTVPSALKNQRTVNLFVPDEELENAESLSTLEGKPISVDHQWQVGGSIDSVGNVAGKPTYNKDSGFLSADILVTDPATIKRITNAGDKERLVDQSAAYRNTIDWVSGISPDGEPFDGIQRNIEYNHIALLPKGTGRAGEEVRILNKDRSNEVVEYTAIKFGSSRIRVMNEDTEKLENEMDKKDKEIENAADEVADKVEKSKKEAETSNEDVKKLKSENEGLQAQITTLKETIGDITSPSSMQVALNKALEEQAASSEILNSFSSGAQEGFAEEIKALHGHDLRAKVVQQIRTQNKKPELTKEEISNEGVVLGMFTALKDTASMVSNKKTISGAEVFKTTNAGGEAAKYATAEARCSLEYSKHKAHFKKNMDS